MSEEHRKLISIIIPAYNEESNVGPMHKALCELSEAESEFDFEFIFVDDGSTDRTFERIENMNRTDSRVKVVRLSRNFGSHIGTSVGMDFVSGDAAVIVPCDLQYHPREIPNFLQQWGEGNHVVWGTRASRTEVGSTLLFSHLFSRIMRLIALPNYPAHGTGSFVLIDRKVIDALRRFPEHNRMVTGLILFTGFKQIQVPVHCENRRYGASKWSFWKKWKLMLDSIISFSSVPIRMASLIGMGLALCSVLYGTYEIFDFIFRGIPVPGFTSLLVSILFIGGIQLIVLGLLGEYIWRTLDEARRRPLYLVWETLGISSKADRRPAEGAALLGKERP